MTAHYGTKSYLIARQGRIVQWPVLGVVVRSILVPAQGEGAANTDSSADVCGMQGLLLQNGLVPTTAV